MRPAWYSRPLAVSVRTRARGFAGTGRAAIAAAIGPTRAGSHEQRLLLFRNRTTLAAMLGPSGSLWLGRAQGAERYFLIDRPLGGGDVGGRISGRFEWDAEFRAEGGPTFSSSVELDVASSA